MADFKINRIRFTWKGDWTAVTGNLATIYTKDDIVRYSGKSYVCLVGHGASVDFNTDLNYIDTTTVPNTPAPKWGLWFDGYEWKGAWTPVTFYDLGDYVQYGSIVYICINSHTSANAVLGLENDQNKWTRYAVTDDWVSNWVINHRYRLNDTVRYGGVVYRCNLGHTSAATLALGLEADLLKWDVLTLANDWKTDWLVNTRYKRNDVVRYGGIVYKCNLGHLSSATALIGIDPDIAKWDVLHNGIDYKVSWVTNGVGYRYKLNDVIKYGPDLYICTTAHAATSTFDTNKFAVWLPGLEFANLWDINVSYVKGDIVTYGGYEYTSNVTNNLGNIPSSSLTEWTLVVKNYNIRNDWVVTNAYRTGDLVRRNGYLYVAIVDSTGVEPTDATKWELVNPGIQWKSAWNGGAIATVVSGSCDGTYATINFTNRQGAPFVVGSIVKIESLPISGFEATSATVVRCTSSSITYANNTLATSFTLGNGILSIAGQTYTIGDVVTYYSTAYICTLKNIATPLITPLSDTKQIKLPVSGVIGSGSVATVYFDVPTTASLDSPAIGASGLITFSTTQPVISIGTKIVVTGSGGTGTLTNGTYWVGASPAPTTTSFTLVTVQGGSTFASTTAGTTTKTFSYAPPATTASQSLYAVGQSITVSEVNPNAYNGTFTVTQASTDFVSYALPGVTTAYVSGGNVINNSTYWNLYTKGDQYQTLQYQGDIQTYDQGTWATTTMGQEGNLLKVSGTTLPVPAWNNFGPVGGVYYVSGTGTDAPGYGTTLNNPFKTVRYACSVVTGPATIFIKTGYYSETLPISVPAGVALCGDELRGTTIQPASTLSLTALATQAVTNYVTANSTVGLTNGTPIRFTNASVSSICTGTTGSTGGMSVIIISTAGMSPGDPIVFSGSSFGGIEAGRTYWILDVVNYNTITLTAIQNSGTLLTLTTDTGTMTCTAGNFGGLTADVLYYVVNNSVTGNKFKVTTIKNSTATSLSTSGGVIGASTTYGSFSGTSIVAAGTYSTTIVNLVPIPGIAGVSTTGSGTGALFAITKTGSGTTYTSGNTTISVVYGGTGYAVGDVITILGSSLGGNSPQNDLVFTLGTSVTNRNISIYGGDVIQDMFYVRNGSGIRNMTLRGLTSELGPNNQYGTRRPLAGAYVSLDPGTGPTDSSVWISTKSPYIQNVTTFGAGCTGCKIDGSLHYGGNRSIVANDFTQVLSDGIGVWCANSGALTELVSVFTYYGHIGYLAEYGGKIRATNGNTSYGKFGAVAEGFDLTETAVQASVNNQNQQAQIALAFSGEATNKIVKLEFSNAGQNYTSGSYSFSGSGTGAIAVMDEFRDNGVFETRITGSDFLAGGSGYSTAGNQAQAGDLLSITLASNDQGTNTVYAGMRLLLTSGTGVGQYGFIQYIDTVSKVVNVCKESFARLTATSTTSVNNLITVPSTSTMYVGMPIVFSPNVQITSVIRTTNSNATMGASSIDATGILTVGTLSGTITVGMLLTGGSIANGVYITSQLTYSPTPSASPTRTAGGLPGQPTLVVSSVAGILAGMLVTGAGVNGTVTVLSINSTTITLSSNLGVQAIGTYNFYAAGTGSTWQTTTTTVQSSTVITGTENTVTVGSTSGMWVTKPVVFTGTAIIGGLLANTPYYILAILPGNKLAISTSLNYPLQAVLNATVNVNATMTATASGTLGGVSSTTPYYVAAANFSSTQFAVSTSSSGTPIQTLTTLPAGTMYIDALGWDNILQATPSIALLDSTSVYSIEPRVEFTAPPYSSTSSSSITNSNWVSIIWAQSKFLAISATGATSTSGNGSVWTTQGSLQAPATAWTDLAFGAGKWVAVMSGNSSGSAYTSDGITWAQGNTVLGTGSWCVCFGQNQFLAICTASQTVATSSDGASWTLTALALPAAITWSSVAYGSIGIFVAIASGGTAAASSPDGITWTARTLPGSSAAWTSVVWGNGRFVAIASAGATAAYSLDGITWYASTLPAATTWTCVDYGQGLFFAVASGTSTAATSPDGLTWTPRTLASSATWKSIAFGNPTKVPTWCAVSNGSTTTTTNAGATALGRAVVSSGKISQIKIWEPGSNYVLPTVTVTDPNSTLAVTLLARVGTGVLGNPTFVNKGSGYRSSTTVATVQGTGYADIYQNSKYLSVSGLSVLPTPGAALTFGSGVSSIYRIVVITDLSNGKALFQISPPLNNLNAPEHGSGIFIRQKYSQCRITGHDFLLIGTGNQTATNYPNVDVTTATSYRQMTENGGGRVFQTSTDQDGNFMVGNLFGVQQASGIVTISADQFSLTGLDKLTLGGFALGTNSVIITQFSTDSYFTANSDSVVPTQKAIKTYLARNIAGGGSNAQTGQVTAGTVGVGGPNKIFSSTLSQVLVTNSMHFRQGPLGGVNGAVGGINGTMLAHEFFAASFSGGPNNLG
jgi:hypothetical protein